jgi:hypothetical protein
MLTLEILLTQSAFFCVFERKKNRSENPPSIFIIKENYKSFFQLLWLSGFSKVHGKRGESCVIFVGALFFAGSPISVYIVIIYLFCPFSSLSSRPGSHLSMCTRTSEKLLSAFVLWET